MPTGEGASLIETGDVRLLEAQVAGAEILAVAEAMARIGTAEGRLGLARPRFERELRPGVRVTSSPDPNVSRPREGHYMELQRAKKPNKESKKPKQPKAPKKPKAPKSSSSS